jgi:DNA-binding GntR family transcriptional regulator
MSSLPSASRPRGRPKVRPKVGPAALAVNDESLGIDTADTGDAIETRIYQAVVDSVMSQRLTPGTKLPEAALCELFGVGRTLVQKVLQKLAHDHIVELRPNRGAIVAMPSREEVGKLFEARRALEAAIMPLVVEHATKADLTALRRQLKEEHHAMHRYKQTEWARLASSFHLRLAELSRNTILQRYLGELVSRCSLVVALFEPPGNASCEHDEHQAVVDCIAARDAQGAVRAMEAHLLVLENRINLIAEKPGKSLAHMLGME